MDKAELYIVAALAAVGLYVYLDLKKGVASIGGAASSAGENIGLKLADVFLPKSQQYLGYPSKYVDGKWYVLVDGKWFVDQYQTEQAQAITRKAATTKSAA